VLHCGGANRSEHERALFYFSFLRKGRAPALRRSSLLESLRGACRLDSAHWLHAPPQATGQLEPHGAAAPAGKRAARAERELELRAEAPEDEEGDCLPS
jgi:hypothetical protein